MRKICDFGLNALIKWPLNKIVEQKFLEIMFRNNFYSKELNFLGNNDLELNSLENEISLSEIKRNRKAIPVCNTMFLSFELHNLSTNNCV